MAPSEKVVFYFMLNKKTKIITRAGIIASAYAMISLIVFPISSGAVQFRISEGLTLLALVFPEAIPALAIGCLISNLITGCALLDVVFGTLITLVAGLMTYAIGKVIKNHILKVIIGGLFPVLLNAFLLPLIWIWCYGVIQYVYYVQVALLVSGQALSVYALGAPLYFSVVRLKGKGIEFFN